MTARVICRECQETKHGACDGKALLEVGDGVDTVPCTCYELGHNIAAAKRSVERQAALMYAGTEGHSGSEASEDRAHREAHDGTASARQSQVLDLLAVEGVHGATWHELGALLNLHHGQVTSALSNLHKAERIARLNEKRGRSSVYVLPEHVDGRHTVAQGRGRGTAASPYPHALDSAHVALGPNVTATIDGAEVVWNGRRYHPLDVHDSRRSDQGAPEQEGLFDL